MSRLLALAAALSGTILVTLAWLRRHDPYRAALVGPRWRMRLVAAGLAALGAAGPACSPAAKPAANDGPTTPQVARQDLPVTPAPDAAAPAAPATAATPDAAAPAAPATAATPDAAAPAAAAPATTALPVTWRDLFVLRQDAERILSNQAGSYPFDRKGKDALMARLAAVPAAVDRLVVGGKCTKAEGELLKLDFARLSDGVSAFRPTELEMATCYEPMWANPVQEARARLDARLPLLEKVAAQGKVRAEILAKVLQAIEADAATLDSGSMVGVPRPSLADDPANAAVAKRARAAVARIRALPKATP